MKSKEEIKSSGAPIDYAWMEDDQARLKAWLEQSNAAFQKSMDSLSLRETVEKNVSRAALEEPRISGLDVARDSIIFKSKESGSSVESLYAKDLTSGAAPKLLLDGNQFQVNTKLHYYEPSPSGKILVFGFAKSDNEIADLQIMDTAKGTIQETPIDQIVSSLIVFHPSETKFLYQRHDNIFHDDPSLRKKDAKIRMHDWKAKGEADVLVASISSVAEPAFDANDRFSSLRFLQGGSLGILTVQKNQANPRRLYYKAYRDFAKASAPWKQVFGEEAKVLFDAASDKDYYLAFLNAESLYQIDVVRFEGDSPKREKFLTIADGTVESMVGAKDALYILKRDGLTTSVLRIDYRNPQKVQVVKAAEGEDFSSISGSSSRAGVFLHRSSYARPTTLALWSGQGQGEALNLQTHRVPIKAELNVTQEFVNGHDGTKIPLVIVKQKDTPFGPQTPIIIDAYGSYANVTKPGFQSVRSEWYRRGGAIAYCMVRGGGELGAKWHEGGRRLNKINSAKDAVSCAEHLIAKGYTSSSKLALYTSSAGAVISGYFITRHPQLVRAVVSEVGMLNISKLKKTSIGFANIPEFGDPDVPEEAAMLRQLDGYENLREKREYPAFLGSHGFNDTRVPVWFSTKFAARLMDLQTSQRPVLFYGDLDSGHGLNAGSDQRARRWSAITSFLLWQLDVTGT